MAVSVELDTVASGYNLTKINNNFTAIQDALEDALSRSGGSPNQMEADLDLNEHSLLNVNELDVASLTVNGVELVTDELIAKGDPGEAATVVLGSVSTGTAGSSVIITNTGNSQNAVLNFTIPRGDTGASGAGSGDVVAAQNLNDLANKASAFANIKQAATDTTTGVVELATNQEAITGSDTTRVITPAGLTAKLNNQTGYRLRNRLLFLSNSSYTPTAGVTLIDVTMVGGGGGGGGARGGSSEAGGASGGGGSGAETISFQMSTNDFTSPVPITIGSGGSGGSSSGGDGGNGSDTSFGSYAVAKRGLGGSGVNAPTSFVVGNGAHRSSNGTLPVNGLRFHGSDGDTGSRGDGGAGSQTINMTSGRGGDSHVGGGGGSVRSALNDSNAGRDAGNYGAGGGGAASKGSGVSGGSGSNGFLLIYEYTNGA